MTEINIDSFFISCHVFSHELLLSNDRLSNYSPKFDVKPNSAQKVKGREMKETDRQREKKWNVMPLI